ncbi:MAG: (2Fe-2S)-binding protein [Elusimicrobia bacterium]|nr:(2Fe-2S)-binding protein [Elusimicrobiota bacterium]
MTETALAAAKKEKKSGQMIKFSINGKAVEVEAGQNILRGAEKAGIYIPTLCYHPDLEAFGGCRLCIVEVKGMRGYPTACTTPAAEGMEVKTDTDRLRQLRRSILEMILTEHPHVCLICSERNNCKQAHECTRRAGITTACGFCPKNGQCGIQAVAERLELKDVTLPFSYKNLPIDRSTPFFDRDDNLCILCGRCVRACKKGVIKFMQRGSQAIVDTAPGTSHVEAECEFCGACVDHCPTGSLVERKRRWDGKIETQAKTICPFCSVGCELTAGVSAGGGSASGGKQGRVIETLTNENGCLLGRFCATLLNDSSRRITAPMMRRSGKLVVVPWEDAIAHAAKAIKKSKGKTALVYSASCTNEDMFALRQFASKVLETAMISCPGSSTQKPVWRRT